MKLQCRFSLCQWRGPEGKLFDHLETCHKKLVREPKGKLYFDLTFDDLQHDALVLCSLNGLYWFRQNIQQPRNNGIDFGLFHIGGSDQVECMLKLGLKQDGYCKYWGPYTSQQDDMHPTNKEEYNFKFDFDYLEIIRDSVPSRRLRLYFGDYDDSDDKSYLTPQDIEWKEDNERINALYIERFTCAICLEYIRREARFCEHKHFVCLKCFDNMKQRKTLKCPICRGQYLYDCMDHNVEHLLRILKWPDISDIETKNN